MESGASDAHGAWRGDQKVQDLIRFATRKMRAEMESGLGDACGEGGEGPEDSRAISGPATVTTTDEKNLRGWAGCSHSCIRFMYRI
jgi:hypothetical protein